MITLPRKIMIILSRMMLKAMPLQMLSLKDYEAIKNVMKYSIQKYIV
jgi:hypothetical protein